MDEDSGATQTEQSPDAPDEEGTGGSSGGNDKRNRAIDAVGAGYAVKNGAGGEDSTGDGMTGGKSPGSDPAHATGSGTSPGASHSTSSNGAGAVHDAETGSKPHDTNDTSGDKKNPASADFAKKVALDKVAEKSQVASDAIQTANDVKNVGRAVESGGADIAADIAIAKELAHPVELAKRSGRLIKYFAIFEGFQALIVVGIVGIFFFGLYKQLFYSKHVWFSFSNIDSIFFSSSLSSGPKVPTNRDGNKFQ